MTDSDSRAKGREILQRLGARKKPDAANEPSGDMFFDLAENRRDFPDFWKMTQEHIFGEVWSRPGLALRDRSMITMVALTVLGKPEELKGHMGYALNIGITKEEILEMIMHVAHYAGWPTGVNALRVAKEVFREEGVGQ